MKKFKFSLDNVLNYKNQVLEELKREHALIIAAVVKKESEIKALEGECREQIETFNEGKEQGMSVLDALSYQSHIDVLWHNIKKEYEKLENLQMQETAKRKQVVAARTETSSFEKLKEKRLEEYNVMVQKSEEQFVEEFVANKSIAQGL